MNLKKSKIIVTGSSGTIGNTLCERLEAEECNVLGVDKRVNQWQPRSAFNTVIHDLREPILFDMLGCPDVIVHFAANARVFNLVKDPSLAMDNFLMLYNVLEFARRNNVKKILFSSSREVYGNSGSILHKETESYTENCESPYTATKIAGEVMLRAYQQCYGIDFITVRFSNVFGKYDFSDRVIPLFILKASQNEDLHVFGQDKILDFTYVDDAVDGTVKALECFEYAKNEVYNIATQIGYSIGNVAKMIVDLTESKSKIIDGVNRTGEVCRFVSDISKAKAILKYCPYFSIIGALQRTISWYLPRLEQYKTALKNDTL